MTLKGLCEPNEMLRYRRMIIELNNNLDSLPLNADRQIVQFLIKTTRTFTIAEMNRIDLIHLNFTEREKKLGKKAGHLQQADEK